jgi:crossover junction endodeoxyribonuclease RuvC
MIVLGIDPGTITMGYGVISSEQDTISLLTYGAWNTNSRSPIGERLSFLYSHLIHIIEQFKPDIVAVERPFVAKNAQSAFAVGRAQAVAILAASNQKKDCCEYTPREIKQRVSDYGAGSKQQIQQMVMFQLAMDHLPEPEDAADALAVALCHLQAIRLNELLERQG